MDDPALVLLAALMQEDGATLIRLRKRSGLPMSSVLRAASEMIELGWARRVDTAGRECLQLTDEGWKLCHPN